LLLTAASSATPAVARVFQQAGWYVVGTSMGAELAQEGPFADKPTCDRRLDAYNTDDAFDVGIVYICKHLDAALPSDN
jgi:hypothetical protein